MNLQYLRYALEVARTGSISKAADNLSVAQPNLSRAVKELESGLGIAIFDRTRTGMTVTPEGERLLTAGERILRDVDELETMFDGEDAPRETLSVTVPHADYISLAFADFCRDLPEDGRYDLTLCEAGATDAMGAVARGESRLGIIRYPLHFESYYAGLLSKRELSAETAAELTPVILAGEDSPLAALTAVTPADLAALYEITSPDTPSVEAIGTGDGQAAAVPDRRLLVTDRAARRDLLLSDPNTYERALPLPADACARRGLIRRPLAAPPAAFRDVLIYPAHYRLTPLDKRFLAALRACAKASQT